MARRSRSANRSRYSPSIQVGRDLTMSITNAFPALSRLSFTNPYERLRVAQFNSVDRRLRDPAKTFRSKLVSGVPAPFKSSYRRDRNGRVFQQYSFQLPARTAICVRRSIRREVVMSQIKSKTFRRKSGGGGRRNVYSEIKC